LYNVSEGQILAYYLDPERTLPILQEQERASRISAQAVGNAGIQLTAAQASDLAKRGYTEEQAMSNFGNINRFNELKQQFAGEEAISEQEIIGAQFGYDASAEQKLLKRKAGRLAEFQGGGSFANRSGATQGSIQTGLGKAE
jgi:hypothetical protein